MIGWFPGYGFGDFMQIALLYALTALIWGSTWLAITFQLGTVDPEISVVYRFALASGILIVYSLVRRLPMRFTLREHGFMALQGLTLFSINYVLVYLAELHLASGYVAIVFSLIVVFNVLFGAAFLRNPIRPRVLLGGAIGIVGLSLVFLPNLGGLNLSAGAGLCIVLALVGTIIASLGNIVSARNQQHKIPVVQANAYGMGYGALITLGIGIVRGSEISFDASAEYVLSALPGNFRYGDRVWQLLDHSRTDRARSGRIHRGPIPDRCFAVVDRIRRADLGDDYGLGRGSGGGRKRHRDDPQAAERKGRTPLPRSSLVVQIEV